MKTEQDEPQRPSRRSVIFGLLAGALVLPASETAAQVDRPLSNRRRLRRWRRRQRKRRQRFRRQREFIQRGRVKPLYQVMRNFQSRIGAEVLDVNFRQVGPYGVYVFVVLHPGGRIARYVVDGQSEQIFTPPQARRHYGFGD